MNNIQENIFNLSNDWKKFPFKLDYIIRILFSNNDKAYEIHFKRNNNFYNLCFINDPNQKNKEFECDNFPISANELLNHLNINMFIYNDFVQFTYKTQIFEYSHLFRGQKSLILNDDLIILRLSSKYSNFNKLNSKLGLFISLNDNLSKESVIDEEKQKL